VVDTDALTAEVLSGRLHCALDVVDPEPLPSDHPLWRSENALITPHIGGNASAFEPRIVKLLAQQLEALAKGTARPTSSRKGRSPPLVDPASIPTGWQLLSLWRPKTTTTASQLGCDMHSPAFT
jgi:phosphoglycerate dehydrogenase-like enzyme